MRVKSNLSFSFGAHGNRPNRKPSERETGIVESVFSCLQRGDEEGACLRWRALKEGGMIPWV